MGHDAAGALGDRFRQLFLSYADADRARALAIADALEAAGVPVWIDRRGIVGGDLWAAEISVAIRSCSHLAVLCSTASVNSRNVRQELQLAWDYDRPILPLMLEPVQFPPEIAYFLHGRQWIDVLELPEDQWLAPIAAALRSHSVPLTLQELAPPSRPSSVAPVSHLPLLPLTVIGRESDIAEVARLLQSGTRLLVLTGPGGIGKTTLAISVATTMQAGFPDGVWYIDLAPLQTPETAIAAIAQAVGVRELGVATSVEDLASTLRYRSALLLIDNAEHLRGIEEVVGGLLAGAPSLSILVTSRRPLHLRIERVFPVQSLPTPATRDFAAIEASPAVRLFVDRAQACVPDFRLDSRSADAVARICQRVDGLPLAIELAAARLRLFTPAQLLQRLEQSFLLLSGGAVDAPNRQRTLADTVLWSVELLSAADQALFRRLAVFVSGFTFEAAEAVAQRPTETYTDPLDVLEGLDALVDNGLVTRSGSPGGDLRFGMLATIHEVALDLLKASSEDIEMRNRQAEWCLDVSSRVGHLAGFDRAVAVRNDLADFRSALAWLEQKGDAVGYKTIAGNLAFAWNLVDNREAQQVFRRAPGRDEPSDLAVHAHFMAGWLNADKEWFERTSSLEARFADLRELCEGIGDVFGQAYAAHELASVYVSRGEWDSAAESLALARVLWQSIPQPSWDLMSGLSVGSVAFYRGDIEEAERRFREVQEVLEESLADTEVLAACSDTWLSLVDSYQGRMSSAASRALRALGSFRATGMLTMLTGWTGAAAWIVRSVEPANAWMFGEALRIQQATGYNYNLTTADPKLLPGVAITESGSAGRAPITLDALAALLEERLQILAS